MHAVTAGSSTSQEFPAHSFSDFVHIGLDLGHHSTLEVISLSRVASEFDADNTCKEMEGRGFLKMGGLGFHIIIFRIPARVLSIKSPPLSLPSPPPWIHSPALSFALTGSLASGMNADDIAGV